MLDLDQVTRDTIRRSFSPVLAGREKFADAFYTRLFEQHPELRALFPPDLSESRRKFVDMLVVLVDAATTLGPVRRIMQELGARHVAYGVLPEHYPIVVPILIHTLRASGDEFDEEAERAWGALLAEVSSAMLSGADRAAAARTSDARQKPSR